jgi:hypothetical protein
MIGNSKTPRPYVVTLRRPADDEIVQLRVLAYDIVEAMVTATARVTRTHGTSLLVDDVVPDETALNEQQSLERSYAAALTDMLKGPPPCKERLA